MPAGFGGSLRGFGETVSVFRGSGGCEVFLRFGAKSTQIRNPGFRVWGFWV